MNLGVEERTPDGSAVAWSALCEVLGAPENIPLPDLLAALDATAVPLEVARRILLPNGQSAA